jgi:hypothetical protein
MILPVEEVKLNPLLPDRRAQLHRHIDAFEMDIPFPDRPSRHGKSPAVIKTNLLKSRHEIIPCQVSAVFAVAAFPVGCPLCRSATGINIRLSEAEGNQ